MSMLSRETALARFSLCSTWSENVERPQWHSSHTKSGHASRKCSFPCLWRLVCSSNHAPPLHSGASFSCSGSASLSVGWIDVLKILRCGNIVGSIFVASSLTFLTPLHVCFKPFVMLPRPMMTRKMTHAVATSEKISMAISSLLRPERPASFSHCCQAISFLRNMKVAAMIPSSQINVIAL
jgi:hypothetical protein